MRLCELSRCAKVWQTRTGNTLTSLERRWQELVGSVLQIEMANVAMEAEHERLARRATELANAL